jgi:putative transposase
VHLKQALLIVQPDTLLRWHRELLRRIWRRKSGPERKPGRPPLADDVVALIKHLAKEDYTWGAERIRRELQKLRIEVAKGTIQRYIRSVRGPLASNQT